MNKSVPTEEGAKIANKSNLGENLIPISEPRSITEVVESENSKLRKEIEDLRKQQVKCRCQIKVNPAPILKGDALNFRYFFYQNLKTSL